jgi:F-type H+-transporting ATPase subunit b
MSLVALADSASLAVANAGGGGVNVDFDKTLLIQVGLFVALWLILKPMLFDPMLKLFEEREKRIEGAIDEARKIDLKSVAAKTTYDDALAKARAEGASERDRLRGEGIKKENELLGQARLEAQAKLDAGRKQAQSQLTQAKQELAGERTKLARELAARVLGREVS